MSRTHRSNPGPKSNAEARFWKIHQELRRRICLLQYPPGMLLSENRLAEEFDVSRTPIRHVLKRLEFEGLVKSQHGVGTMVTTVDVKLLREVYSLRIKLAELIGELSPVVHAAEDDLEALERLRARCDELRERYDPLELARVNMALNDTLVSYIGNQPLREISDQLYYQTARVWQQILPDMEWTEEVDYIHREITEIAEALRAGDMKRVGQIRHDHISMCLSRINRYLGRADTH